MDATYLERGGEVKGHRNIFASRANFMALPADPQAVRAPFAKTTRESHKLARARLSVLAFGFTTKEHVLTYPTIRICRQTNSFLHFDIPKIPDVRPKKTF